MSSPLEAAHAVTKLPAQDLGRARDFYLERLGLEPVEERDGGLRYVCGTTEFHLFASSGSASGASTQRGQPALAWTTHPRGAALSTPPAWIDITGTDADRSRAWGRRT